MKKILSILATVGLVVTTVVPVVSCGPKDDNEKPPAEQPDFNTTADKTELKWWEQTKIKVDDYSNVLKKYKNFKVIPNKEKILFLNFMESTGEVMVLASEGVGTVEVHIEAIARDEIKLNSLDAKTNKVFKSNTIVFNVSTVKIKEDIFKNASRELGPRTSVDDAILGVRELAIELDTGIYLPHLEIEKVDGETKIKVTPKEESKDFLIGEELFTFTWKSSN